MPDSETPAADALEQLQGSADVEVSGGTDQPEVALEAPEADAVEQQTSLRDEAPPVARPDAAWDADEGDLAESAREVPYGDDDYR